MKAVVGKEGLRKSHQGLFPETAACECGGVARHAFTAFEDGDDYKYGQVLVSQLHDNGGEGDYWYHDVCAVAIYFCKECLSPVAIANQS